MSWKGLAVVMLLGAAITTPLVPAHSMDRETAKQQGKALGSMAAGQAQNAATNPNLSNVPGYTTSNPPQTGYNDDNMFDAGVQEAEVNEAAQLLTGSFANRPRYDVHKSDPWLQHGWDVSADPHAIADKFTGKYQDCAPLPGGQWPTPTEYRQCDVWDDFSENTCTVGQVVEVDGGFGYACRVGKAVDNRTCDRYVSVTAVPGSSGCVNGAGYFSVNSYVYGNPSNAYTNIYAYCSGNQLTIRFSFSNGGPVQYRSMSVPGSMSGTACPHPAGCMYSYFSYSVSCSGTGTNNCYAYIRDAAFGIVPVNRYFTAAPGMTLQDTIVDQCGEFN